MKTQSTAVLALLPEALARKHCVIPLGRQGPALRIAIAQPADDLAFERIESLFGAALAKQEHGVIDAGILIRQPAAIDPYRLPKCVAGFRG